MVGPMTQADPRATLDALVTRHGESYAALSRMLGRNPAYLQQFVRRGSPRHLSERDRRQLAAYFHVDEQLLGAAEPKAVAPDVLVVPRIAVVASAGPGALVENDRAAGGLLIDPAIIRRLGANAADVSVIEAQGESMLPMIAPGDLLLVDRGNRRVTQRDAIFVLRVDGVLIVKRVARQAGQIVITSDNPDHPGVDADGVEIIGRVIWLQRMLG